MDYRPGAFRQLSQTRAGSAMWEFLNGAETTIRMETAAQLDRPAVEGIEESLLSEFGEAVLDGRTKQMIGHMVRQIMENRGYVVAQQNVKVTNGAPFTRATRYKKPDCVTYHVHRNIKSTQVLGLTQDRAGSRLPDLSADWTYWKSFKGALRGRIAFGLPDERKARSDITEQGFHIYYPNGPVHAQTSRFPHDLIALVQPGPDIGPLIDEHDQLQRDIEL